MNMIEAINICKIMRTSKQSMEIDPELITSEHSSAHGDVTHCRKRISLKKTPALINKCLQESTVLVFR